MALSQTSVLKLYNTVIDDVISGVRDAFLDEGVDEQVLQEMKQVWTAKLMASKALERSLDQQDQQTPSILSNNSKSMSHSKANGTKKAKAAAAAAAAAANQENQNAANNKFTQNNAPQSTNSAQPIKTEPAASHTEAQSNQQQQIQPPPLAQTVPQPQPAAPAQPPAPPAAVVAALDPNKQVAIQITLPAQPNVHNSQPRVLTIQVPASALQENQLQQVLTGPIITSIMPLPPQIASSVLQQHVNSYLQNNAINTIQLHKQLDGAFDMMETNYDGDMESTEKDAVAVPGNMLIPVEAKKVSSKRGVWLRKKKNSQRITLVIGGQLDGAVDTSDEEASDISDDNIGDDDDDDLDKEDDEDIDGEGGAEEEPLNSEDDVTDEDASDLFDTDNVVVCQYDKITRSRNKWKFYLKDGIMNISGKDYVFQKSNGDAEW
ncbi:transcription initiation factor IIA subunit 1 [Toxorhynchites rutilus septentrionalis]|uniref:transcription initiation factor IIA subunit 1 n=1 Tax=Toxorhynchites rutilus septentrionalis TaxID=329112 RepID=UPI00247AD8D0|nr:transcription initiation factor IIA subunit 1 [Toxorhynchites rutilus septentrionalis]